MAIIHCLPSEAVAVVGQCVAAFQVHPSLGLCPSPIARHAALMYLVERAEASGPSQPIVALLRDETVRASLEWYRSYDRFLARIKCLKTSECISVMPL